MTDVRSVAWGTAPLRSLLFVPGSDERKLRKVGSFGADAIVIDLEDAVADEEKSAARALTRAFIPRCAQSGALVIVRVNSLASGRMAEDVAAVVHPALDGIMLPKVEGAGDLAALDEAIAAAEAGIGSEHGTVRVLALIESAKGVLVCDQILAQAPARTHTCVFGAGDFSAELDIDLTSGGEELLYARSRLLLATRAAAMAKPIDGPWLALEDVEGLAANSARSRGLGFQGRVTVYPPQVRVVNEAYSALSEEVLARMQRIVAAFEEAEARGVASIRVAGEFVDYPIYRLARERLRLAGAAAPGVGAPGAGAVGVADERGDRDSAAREAELSR